LFLPQPISKRLAKLLMLLMFIANPACSVTVHAAAYTENTAATHDTTTLMVDKSVTGQESTGLHKDKVESQPSLGAINVSLAILWSQPSKQYIQMSVAAAAHPDTWSKRLTTQQRLWLVDKADTMALFGEQVVRLDRQGDWLKVAAANQHTNLNASGYPGWVLANQVIVNPTYLEEQKISSQIVVMAPKTILFSNENLTTPKGELSWQVRLPLIGETEKIVEVRLPDGTTGYLPPSVIKQSTELCCNGDSVVIQARKFLGLKYLWAGTSSDGLDCSGLTFRVYQSQGFSIPRDADEQALEGIPIDKTKLLPGDLLFFASNNGQGEIHHVGIYSGNGMMIHAPNSKSQIKEEPFDVGTYHTEYWGARRYGLDPNMKIP